MGYFRAILVKDELSERAYNLTEEIFKHNPGDYHAW
jgi:protein farnesyltransferase/geranylgeranyltransferase type-1 subunit alpha